MRWENEAYLKQKNVMGVGWRGLNISRQEVIVLVMRQDRNVQKIALGVRFLYFSQPPQQANQNEGDYDLSCAAKFAF